MLVATAGGKVGLSVACLAFVIVDPELGGALPPIAPLRLGGFLKGVRSVAAFASRLCIETPGQLIISMGYRSIVTYLPYILQDIGRSQMRC